MKPLKRARFPVLALTLASVMSRSLPAEAAVINAASISLADVAAAVGLALEGDTVAVPAGTAVWSSTLSINKKITFQGAGIGQSIIIDELSREGKLSPLLSVNLSLNGSFRLTGFSIRGGVINRSDNFNGVVAISGKSRAFRLDHCEFVDLAGLSIRFRGDIWGVVDHNEFRNFQEEFIQVFHDGWGNGNYGNGSWADDPYWGTEKFLFIEDNIFDSTAIRAGAIDGYGGARYVVRYNSFTNCTMALHGTEGQINRGAKQVEIYKNLFHRDSAGNAGQFRSGSGLVFSNTYVNVLSGMELTAYRFFNRFSNWGGADGLNPLDSNSPTVYVSGTHSGSDGSYVLIDSNAAWTANQWRKYTIRNLTTGRFSFVTSNTSDTIAFYKSTMSGANLVFDQGDRYEVRLVHAALDQSGRGKDRASAGSKVSPTEWPDQEIEPIYSWHNFSNGKELDLFTSYPGMAAGREYYNRTPKPNYSPFIYPHPLTTLESPLPSSPRNLRIVAQ